MTNISTGYFVAKAALPRGENKLPRFRDPKHDVQVHAEKGIPKEYTKLMGLDCGRRVLPYTLLDRYDRNRKTTRLPAIFLQNSKLKATFLPSLGGRLISLIDLSDNRELLFCNTSLQVANLANRNAWFAGGIEWNIGQYGHAFSTCNDIFASVQKDETGEDFLRLYDYERCKGIWWHMDFHLPEGSPLLYVHTTVHNLYDTRTSLYYWTNIAVEMTGSTRVFASNDEAIYLDPYAPPPVRRYGYMRMPNIDLYPGLDASYPARFPYSQEYFFTCDKDILPWEVAFRRDGKGFFEASTHPLSYRKMFCWGSNTGGRHWQKFLAPELGKEYVEIQSGLAPTQLHGMYLDGGCSRCWTQAFGSIESDPKNTSQQDYVQAKKAASEYVGQQITAGELRRMEERFEKTAFLPVEKILHMGDGWGFLEKELRGIELPSAFLFPEDSVTERELPWKQFLDTGKLPKTGDSSFTYPFVVNDVWLKALQEASKVPSEAQDIAILKHYLGIALLEAEQTEEARQCWLDTYNVSPNAWTARNLAALEMRTGATGDSLEWYRKAIKCSPVPELSIAEEFFKALIDEGSYEEAENFFAALPAAYVAASDYLAIDRARLAAELSDPDTIERMVIDRELGNIREGETLLNSLWSRYCQLRYGKKLPLIEKLDFNQFDPETEN